jgi:hypothetical protein
MARKSLRPQLNQIRTWVRQGRTDAWIAHQLEVTVQQIQAFKREHELAPEENGNGDGAAYEEVDLRAEDDAQIAAELDAEAKKAAEAAEKAAAEAAAKAEAGEKPEEASDEDDQPPRRRRRGGRNRSRRQGGSSALEATFDHGEEGYGLWLDPAVQDDPVYAEHWAGHRPVEVTIEEEQIVIRRAGTTEDEDDG